MTRKILTIGIILFWLVMMGLLLKGQILPRYFKESLISYRDLVPRHLLLKDEWMGIYFNDSKIGYANSYMTVKEKGSISGYSIQNEARMFLPLMGNINRVYFKGATFVDSDGKLMDFDFLLKSDKSLMQVKGLNINDRMLKLNIESSQGVTQRFIPLPKDSILYNPLIPFNFYAKLHKNKRFYIDFFNPLSLTNERVELLVKGKRSLEIFGQDTEAYLIQIDYRGLQTLAWITPEGRLLKQESPLGWTVVSEPAQEAISNIGIEVKQTIDLMDAYSVRSNLVILEPQDTQFLKIRLEGVNFSLKDLEDNRQKLVNQEGLEYLVISSPKIPAEKLLPMPINVRDMEEYLAPSDFIQSRDTKIVKKAREITGNSKDALGAAILLNKWVYKNINKVPTISVPSSLEVLETREGDCNEHTYLFVALARALGIPTKILVGLVYRDGRFFYHAWPAVFVGEWLSMDPTFGQDNADATHIRLFEGELNQQLNLAGILGKLDIHIEEYR